MDSASTSAPLTHNTGPITMTTSATANINGTAGIAGIIDITTLTPVGTTIRIEEHAANFDGAGRMISRRGGLLLQFPRSRGGCKQRLVEFGHFAWLQAVP